MQNRKTKINTNPSPDPNRYRRRFPDPNARIQKFIHYMTIATFAIADLCDSGLSPAEDAFETSHMKGLQGLDMSTIRSPCLTTVQEDGDTDGFVDCYFCRYCKVTV